jgi:hypothetical protein
VNISSTSNVDQVAVALRRWAATTGPSMSESLRTVGKKTVGRAIRFTPHQGGKAAMEKVVARDIRRAIRPLTAGMFASPRFRRFVEQKDYDGMNRALEHIGGAGKLKRVLPFSPSIHRNARNSRGRVSEGMSRKNGFGTFDVAELEAYTAQKQKNVGISRGGWATAMVALGGSATAYIRRHTAQGTFEDKSNDPVRGYIRALNRSPWAGDGADAARVLGNAMKSTRREMAEEMVRRLGTGLAIAMEGSTR